MPSASIAKPLKFAAISRPWYRCWSRLGNCLYIQRVIGPLQQSGTGTSIIWPVEMAMHEKTLVTASPRLRVWCLYTPLVKSHKACAFLLCFSSTLVIHPFLALSSFCTWILLNRHILLQSLSILTSVVHYRQYVDATWSWSPSGFICNTMWPARLGVSPDLSIQHRERNEVI